LARLIKKAKLFELCPLKKSCTIMFQDCGNYNPQKVKSQEIVLAT